MVVIVVLESITMSSKVKEAILEEEVVAINLRLQYSSHFKG